MDYCENCYTLSRAAFNSYLSMLVEELVAVGSADIGDLGRPSPVMTAGRNAVRRVKALYPATINILYVDSAGATSSSRSKDASPKFNATVTLYVGWHKTSHEDRRDDT